MDLKDLEMYVDSPLCCVHTVQQAGHSVAVAVLYCVLAICVSVGLRLWEALRYLLLYNKEDKFVYANGISP